MRAKHGTIGQHASAKQHAAGPDKTMMANVHGFAPLPRLLQIDAVGQDLRAESCEGTECSYRYFISAIDDMAIGNCGVPLHGQLRLSLRIQLEMATFSPQ